MARPRITNNLPRFTAGVQVRAARGMNQALILGASEASVLTPIDTSNLLNSQYRSVDKQGDRIVGTVGYTAEYAAAVHDADNAQTFRRPSAEKEFLKHGFERAEPNIRAVIKGAIKT
ncbi:HK97 gp10 family phage protein [Pseudorhodoferax sp. Leaf265]|uniref:HK97 gp10 family phage protein n=1 Tax=Pseudorhodoferax sp. Leaf265 TaxID=1736315 RepID=UPI0007C7AB1D|nr:HK97 gp10 family phage protein [Pseudorhodoferax sp. Leaf265]